MCEHKRLISLDGPGKDVNWIRWPNGLEVVGYLPDLKGLCNSDSVAITICIDCKTVIGMCDAEYILAEQEEYVKEVNGR